MLSHARRYTVHRQIGGRTVKVIEAVDHAQKLQDHQYCSKYFIFLITYWHDIPVNSTQ